ncbi:MAG: hypothetical protein IPM34_11450 [Saprospiraceae bacterium]|nr:hypothetical protein [Saprospiraceae bacterium]
MDKDPQSQYKIWQPLLLGLVAAIGFYAGIKVKLVKPSVDQVTGTIKLEQNHSQKLQDVISYIQSKYVDSIQHETLLQNALESYLESLDPYSEYIPPTDFTRYQNALKGYEFNVGTELYWIDTNLVFFNTKLHGAAYKSGIRNGDFLLELNGYSAKKDSIQMKDILFQIEESKIDSIWVKTFHRSTNEIKLHSWKSEAFEEPSIKWAHLVNNKVLYLKIDHFIKGTYREFMEVMEEFVEGKKAEDLIIDLRGNQGGLVNEVAYVLNQLIRDKDRLLFKTTGFHIKDKEYKSTGNTFFKISRIAVLIDSCTASAAELFALSLQDLKRARVIGDTSFGKSMILEQFNLADGSAIRLAIGRFTTLGGRNIQRNYQTKPWQHYEVNVQSNSLLPHGVWPDVVFEEGSKNKNNRDLLDYIDKLVVKNLPTLSVIISEHPDRIFGNKDIDSFVRAEYQNCPKDLLSGMKADDFSSLYKYAICAWIFGPEIEGRARLQHDPIIQLAIGELGKN